MPLCSFLASYINNPFILQVSYLFKKCFTCYNFMFKGAPRTLFSIFLTTVQMICQYSSLNCADKFSLKILLFTDL